VVVPRKSELLAYPCVEELDEILMSIQLMSGDDVWTLELRRWMVFRRNRCLSVQSYSGIKKTGIWSLAVVS
jgi:hypothetical protein